MKKSEIKNKVEISHKYLFECFDKDGNLKWQEGFENIVVTAGLNKYLDATLKTGLTTPAWYVGLKNTTAAVAADTMSSKGWSEVTAYSESVRQTYTPGTISGGSVDNSGSKATFSINGSATIGGAFLADNSTKGGTTGTLLGAGEFSSSRSVISGDTVRVTLTCSMTSA
jgi:hypothetical protein